MIIQNMRLMPSVSSILGRIRKASSNRCGGIQAVAESLTQNFPLPIPWRIKSKSLYHTQGTSKNSYSSPFCCHFCWDSPPQPLSITHTHTCSWQSHNGLHCLLTMHYISPPTVPGQTPTCYPFFKALPSLPIHSALRYHVRPQSSPVLSKGPSPCDGKGSMFLLLNWKVGVWRGNRARGGLEASAKPWQSESGKTT